MNDAKPSVSIPNLYPDDTRYPYYIVSPPYVRNSAGIKVLHLLCHSLNKAGQSAFMIICPGFHGSESTNPELLTPIVTQSVIDRHFQQKRCPIVVYPETAYGNRVGAQFVVRYILNFPGLLGGDCQYPANELCFGYSQVLAESVNQPQNVLFIPVSDTRVFYPPAADAPRSGSCFFASKYQVVHGGKLLSVTNGSVEIIRNGPGEQTPSEIAALFRRSEVFYAYENTALAVEALLCGCPTVFLPNDYLTELIGIRELGNDGFAWGTDPAEIERAKATVEYGRQNYLKRYILFQEQLSIFVNITQSRIAGTEYKNKISVPHMAQIGQVHKIIKYYIDLCEIKKEEGLKGILYRIFKKIKIYERGL